MWKWTTKVLNNAKDAKVAIFISVFFRNSDCPSYESRGTLYCPGNMDSLINTHNLA